MSKGESKMGTPANGFTKPSVPKAPWHPTLTVREAVAKYGDSWRLFVGIKSPFSKQHMDSTTQDAIEAIGMMHMERGIKRRVEP